MRKLFSSAHELALGKCVFPVYEKLRGRNTFAHWSQLESNQWLGADEIADIQRQKLSRLLKHSYETVDYYRSMFESLDAHPDDIKSASDFATLPILDKQIIRNNKTRLLSNRYDASKLIKSSTGGSTGEPMQFSYSRETYDRRIAATMRGDTWAGWSIGAAELYFWGVPLIPQTRLAKLKVRAHHWALNRSVINSYDLSPQNMESAVHSFNRAKPKVVIGYTNALYQFARYVRAEGLQIHRPGGVITTAEKSFEYQRTTISEVFGAPVFDRYGSREVMLIGAECDHHKGLHVTADNLFVEIEKNGRLCEADETGRILLTDLHNYAMPLIRYQIGDVGSWKGDLCTCGRGLPLMNIIEGRLLDVITTPSGRIIAGEVFPRIFRDMQPVRTYQVLQTKRDSLSVKVALDRPIPDEDRRILKQTLAEVLQGELHVEWEIGEGVEIEQGRKFRPVQSLVEANFNGSHLQ